MATIVIQLDPKIISNPDADLRYAVADLLIGGTAGLLTDDGYDYMDNGRGGKDLLQIYLETPDAAAVLPKIVTTLASVRLYGNDLSAVPIAVEDDDRFAVVHPVNFSGQFPRPRDSR